MAELQKSFADLHASYEEAGRPMTFPTLQALLAAAARIADPDKRAVGETDSLMAFFLDNKPGEGDANVALLYAALDPATLTVAAALSPLMPLFRRADGVIPGFAAYRDKVVAHVRRKDPEGEEALLAGLLPTLDDAGAGDLAARIRDAREHPNRVQLEVDAVIGWLDERLKAGQFGLASLMLSALRTEEITVEAGVAALVKSGHALEQTNPGRADFRARFTTRLRGKAPHAADGVLKYIK